MLVWWWHRDASGGIPSAIQAANVYHEKSVDESAQIVGISPATVKTHMFYSRKNLAELVTDA